MKELTKAEEQVMQYIWKLKKAFLKDVVESFPEPRPAYTTISTVIRVLVKKGFVAFNTYGKIHEYYPVLEKKVYLRSRVKGLVHSFFNGSSANMASFFAEDEDMNLTELEELKALVDNKIKKLKDGAE